MKFGKEFASQMVQEWRDAYMDYNSLKRMLKDLLIFRQKNAAIPTRVSSLKRRLSLYRSFSGLTSLRRSPKSSSGRTEDEVILVHPEGSEGYHQTMFLRPSEEGGEIELMFFRRLDDEFNKVIKFYKIKVEEVKMEAEKLSKQMDALIALRIKVHKPLADHICAQPENFIIDVKHSPASRNENQGRSHMDVIEEIEMSSDESSRGNKTDSHIQRKAEVEKRGLNSYRPAPLDVLNQVKITVHPETPASTLRNVLVSSKSELTFSKEELRKAETRMRKAFIEFYHMLRLLKNYSFLNQLAFSKVMKKYDKTTSRTASKSYLEMVDNSYLGTDEVPKLIEKVEASFIKHFSNGNRRKGMKSLRQQPKRERHRVTFFLGLFTGCTIALMVAIIVSVHARHLLKGAGGDQYMETIFPLYSLFGYIVLHIIMYAGNIYFWRRFRVNYPFIFNFKQGTELGFREVLLVASALSVLTLAATLSNLNMDMDPRTKSFKTITELVPVGLLTAVLVITFLPFNIIYRSSRFFLIRCAWHCLCAPLYKVTLPDFFLADQLTSQVQAIRCLLFYVCYYGWGDFRKRSNTFQDSTIYEIFYFIVAIIPFWCRFIQCVRRFYEEKDSMQGLNSLKYFSTIVALVMRTCYDLKRGTTFKILAAVSSGLTTIGNTYWDVVIDWGLLNRRAKYSWLRDKILVPKKTVYYAAIVINMILRLVWMQLVLDFKETSFLHSKALTALVAGLEILRRGIWNFFRLENEHLNNVGKYRAFKSVPLPFNYDED